MSEHPLTDRAAADCVAEAKALVERLDGFTPGPWDASGLTVYDTCVEGVASCHTNSDATLIAAAPDMHRTIGDLLAVIERQRAALSFYADPENYEPSIIKHDSSCSLGDPPIEEDGGERARAALGEKP